MHDFNVSIVCQFVSLSGRFLRLGETLQQTRDMAPRSRVWLLHLFSFDKRFYYLKNLIITPGLCMTTMHTTDTQRPKENKT